jgi:hypothetical protein
MRKAVAGAGNSGTEDNGRIVTILTALMVMEEEEEEEQEKKGNICARGHK